LVIDHVFSKNIRALGPSAPGREFVSTCDVIIFAVPTGSMRVTLASLDLPAINPLPLLIFVNKGIEEGTNMLPLEVIEQVCGVEIAKVSCFLVSYCNIQTLSLGLIFSSLYELRMMRSIEWTVILV
jgi:hypothetical protein